MPRVRPRLPARLAGVALGASAVVALLAGQAAQASVPAVAGYRDFGYGGAQATRVTSDPEQSKLWYNDGSWWGGLFVSSGRGSGGSHFNIYKFNPATHAWTDTTRQIDSRDHSHADYLWDGTKLYVVSSKSVCDKVFDGAQPCNDSIRVYRFSYNSASPTLAGKYTLDAGFPKILAGGGFTGPNFTGGGSNAITIAKDSTGGVWVVFNRDDPTTVSPPITGFRSNVWVSHSTDGVTWPAPTRFAAAADGQLGQENTAAVVAFGGDKIGVYWTDKHSSGDSPAYFSVHTDGDPDGTWSSPETVTTGTNAIENQVNLKADSTGKVYAVAKTGLSDQIKLFDRATNGTWSAHTVSTAGNGNTRAQVLVDEELGLAYVLSSSGGTTAGTIYIKAAPLNTLSFPTGKGTVFIQSTLDPSIDDVTTTKQVVNATTGILAEASDRTSFEFLHGEQTLAATDVTAPVGSLTVAAGADFTATASVTLTVPATDSGSGVALVRVANDSHTTGGVLDDAGAVSFTWAPTVPWTLAAGDGPKTVYAQFRDSAGNWSVPVSDAITLDTTGPVGNVTINGGAAVTNNATVSLDVTATDAGIGTVTNVRVANVGTTSAGVLTDPSAVTMAYSPTVSWTLAAGADGPRTVYVQWQDGLGNWSGVDNDGITLDTTAPAAGTVSIDEGATTTSSSIHLTLTNPGGATNIRIAESPAGLATATPQAYAASTPYTLKPGLDGTRTVYVQWLDDAGNASPAASDSIVLDLRKPVGTVAINGPAYTGVHSLAVRLYFPNTDTDIDQITVSNSPTMAGSQTFAVSAPFTGWLPWTLPGPLTNRAVKHVYVTFHDIAGNTSAPLPSVAYSATDTAVVDLTKPVMHSPVIASWVSATTLTGSTIPLRVSWPFASDTITGVGSYRVYQSRDGGAFLPVGAPTTRTFTVLAAAGHTYRFRVFAVDRAGNISASVYSATMRAIAYQNNSAAVKFSTGWGTATDPAFYGGTARYSNTRAKTASLTFSGRSVSWLAALGPTRGSARVYVDGTLVATVNLNAGTNTARRVVFARTFSAVGTHSIRVTVLGTAGHPRVDVDAFFVLR